MKHVVLCLHPIRQVEEAHHYALAPTGHVREVRLSGFAGHGLSVRFPDCTAEGKQMGGILTTLHRLGQVVSICIE